MSAELGALEAMDTARSMRWLKPDPVPAELIERVIWAGTRASNANNTQPWDFVVVTAPEVKAKIADAIAGRSAAAAAAAAEKSGDEPAVEWSLPTDPVQRRTAQGAMNLVGTLHSVPAIVFVCGANIYPEDAPNPVWMYSAVFAAAQNMLVAARALGLGAAFTTFHEQAEPEIRSILGVPSDRTIGVTMPIGWPARLFGPVTRRPVAEVLHHDVW